MKGTFLKYAYLAWVLLFSVFLFENYGESIIRWQVANSKFLAYTLAMKSGQPSIFDAFYLLNLIFPILMVLIVSLCSVAVIGNIMSNILCAIHSRKAINQSELNKEYQQ